MVVRLGVLALLLKGDSSHTSSTQSHCGCRQSKSSACPSCILHSASSIALTSWASLNAHTKGHKFSVINLAFSAHHALHFWQPAWRSDNDRPRAGSLSPPWLTCLGAGLSLPITPSTFDELEVAKDTLEAAASCSARAKGAVARAQSLSISVSVGKVSSYLPLQRASASGLCPLTVRSFQAARPFWLYIATPFSE